MASSCSIKRVHSKRAVIANFVNGRLKEDQCMSLNFHHLSNKEEKDDVEDEKSQFRSVLVAEREADTCKTYIGDTNSSKLSSQFHNYYVGVRNKKTGKMKVYDAELFKMIPQVKVEEKSEDNKSVNLPLSYMDQMKELTKAFGSNKRQRLVGQAERNAIKVDALESAIGSAVDHAVSQENFTDIMTQKSGEETSNIIPPHDTEAQKPENIYKSEKIIGITEMAALSSLSQKLFDFRPEEFKNDEGFGQYVMNRLPILPLDETRRWEKCKCLMYIHCLIVLYKKKAFELRSKDVLPKEWPDIIRSSILNNFTLTVKGDGRKKPFRCMSVKMKDKVVLYILVLCLIVDNFTLEYSDILKDLKIGEKRMPLLLKSIGCQIKTRSINKIRINTAHLTAPLQLPSQNTVISRNK